MIVEQNLTGGESPTPSPPACPRPKAKSNAVLRISLLATLALLVVTLIGVIWVLPRYVNKADIAPIEVPAAHSRAVPPSAEQTKRAREKRTAERALGEFLQRQAILEGNEVSTWGGEEYERVLHTLAAADAAFANGDFELANTEYTTATALLNDLDASKPQRLKESLLAAATALENFDAEAAQHHYQVALALQPQNGEALAGSKRAATLSQLAAMLAQAKELEQRNEWTAALRIYEQATALDSQSIDARQGVTRAAVEVEAAQFRALMSTALVATKNRNFDLADEALSAARKLKPNAADVRDAEERLHLARQHAAISAHRQRANTMVEQERWHDAAAEYKAVLVIDPQAQFAMRGRQHSERLAALHDQLDQYIKQPARLQSAEPRANAHTLLETLESMQGKGSRLTQKQQRLSTILELAETPVEVQLRSDDMTDVRIDRFGNLGRFKQSTVTLRPGNYVVRGSRIGYRDVRIDLVVTPGTAMSPLIVQCEERI